MAKALVGHLNNIDPRVVARLTGENRRLRERVADLEAFVMRLQAENDALATTVAASVHDDLLTVDQMQPV
jgi:DNA polymerase/3'-5' exonuclease PolX